MTTKHDITPHKGGRTERLNARLTPEEKTRLKALLKRDGLSLSDWIMRQVEKQKEAMGD